MFIPNAGHVNHDIFWTNLAPHKDCAPPSGELKAAIEAKWKSVDAFQSAMSTASAGVMVSTLPHGYYLLPLRIYVIVAGTCMRPWEPSGRASVRFSQP